ncbi:mannose-1-phosphate guanylyltransferase / mannose-6-phosphate isomerase [Desulfoscipio geothermicus DSM 3669]|uniref:Mannose-1-phosphate guanylyltransferase / mannose-6-phosphate isomerase n=1 Tax=Desulfoscipio geothermicus DSM 3669 TaxID=1121426 RepID=A0A1I6DK55_9FIRM|nr:mannose-1-phosphate guanylyltransferase / mannose-6-phosphate isomerase [Desulfoscipio geothermicus DSM 3669]
MQLGEYLEEDDIVRFDDDFGRAFEEATLRDLATAFDEVAVAKEKE